MILSAKYGFISPDYKLPGPYNVTFKKRSTNPVPLSTLHEQIKIQDLDRFDIIVELGGKEYRQMIEQAFAGSKTKIVYPFAGLQIGKMMQATKKAITSNKPFQIKRTAQPALKNLPNTLPILQKSHRILNTPIHQAYQYYRH